MGFVVRGKRSSQQKSERRLRSFLSFCRDIKFPLGSWWWSKKSTSRSVPVGIATASDCRLGYNIIIINGLSFKVVIELVLLCGIVFRLAMHSSSASLSLEDIFLVHPFLGKLWKISENGTSNIGETLLDEENWEVKEVDLVSRPNSSYRPRQYDTSSSVPPSMPERRRLPVWNAVRYRLMVRMHS